MVVLRRLASSPFVAAVSLVAAIVVAYAFSLRGGFLWDDDLHITANPTIIGPLGLKEIWTTARANYFPLVLTNFWLQHALWGLEPLGYRVVTLLWHAMAAVLLWRVLLRLRVPGAWLGAALWALHPVQVESVAWICELKNTQSAVFFLLAIWCYVRWREEGGRVYGFALGCGLLALLSKPSTVMLPGALALAAWWIRPRFTWRDWLPLLPFFGLSLLAAGWTIWEQKHHSGALGPLWNQTLPERLEIAGRVIWFYLAKLAWPEPLIFIYPRWQVTGNGVMAFFPLLGAVGGLMALWYWRHRGRAWAAAFVAATFFIVLLFPVLGFFSVYFFRYSFVGDHFQYLASMGPMALAGATLVAGLRRHAVASAAVGLLALGILAGRQSLVYLDSETLWRSTLARNPQAIMAWCNLGDTLLRKGRIDDAIAVFTHVTRTKPDEYDAFNDLGGAFLLQGRNEEALGALSRARELAPKRAEVHNNLGNVLGRLGRSDEAVASYQRALELKEDFAEAHNNLGAELAQVGRPGDALVHFERSLQIEPENASALNNLGNALRLLGRIEEAMARHKAALRLKPDSAEALAGLGYALAVGGGVAEGLSHLQRAMALSPGHAGICGKMGRTLVLAGQLDEAVKHFQRAVELAPHSAEAHNDFGTALAQCGRRMEAMVQFREAVRLAPQFAPARVNLGNALLAESRWLEAEEQLAEATRWQADDANAQARLGVARVNAGRLEEAVAPFEAALRLRPQLAEVHEQFAQLLRALGRNREAWEHLERAADLRRTPH